MKNTVLTVLFEVIVFLAEMLFFYAAGVRLTGLYVGISGSYAALVSNMVMGGCVLLGPVFHKLLSSRKHTPSLERWSDMIKLCILAGIFARMYIPAAAVTLLTIVTVYYRNRMPKVISRVLQVMCFGIITGFIIYMFYQGMIDMADTLMMMEGGYSVYLKRKYPVCRESETVTKNDICVTLLYICRNTVLAGFAGYMVPVFLHILNEGTLYSFSQERLPLTALFLIYGLLEGLTEYICREQEKSNLTCVIANTAVFILMSPLLFRASFTLGIVFILTGIASFALYVLLRQLHFQDERNMPLLQETAGKLFVIVVINLAILLYDGIFVDRSVVFLAVFLVLSRLCAEG